MSIRALLRGYAAGRRHGRLALASTALLRQDAFKKKSTSYICPPLIRSRLYGCPVPAMGDQPIDSGRRGDLAQDPFRIGYIALPEPLQSIVFGKLVARNSLRFRAFFADQLHHTKAFGEGQIVGFAVFGGPIANPLAIARVELARMAAQRFDLALQGA
jgi:hypothetical protein